MALDPNLSRHFRKKDEIKGKRQIYQKTIAYKSNRSANKHLKLADAHIKQLEEQKTGAMYKTGVAVKAAKQSIKKAKKRNPVGTLSEDWKCPYYHTSYCQVTGHTGCGSPSCAMKSKTKEEREAALQHIASEAVDDALNELAYQGKGTG